MSDKRNQPLSLVLVHRLVPVENSFSVRFIHSHFLRYTNIDYGLTIITLFASTL